MKENTNHKQGNRNVAVAYQNAKQPVAVPLQYVDMRSSAIAQRKSMKIRNILLGILTVITMNSNAQVPIDLSKLQMNEVTQTLIKDLPNVKEGKMFDRDDMISYGITGPHFSYDAYVPKRLELLSYQGTVAGYAFRISSIAEQNKIQTLLNERGKLLSGYRSKSITIYKYKDAKVIIELRAITKTEFDGGMFGYLDVKRIDFNQVYEKLLKQ